MAKDKENSGPVVPDPIVRPEEIVRPPVNEHPDRTQSIPMVWVCNNVGCSETPGVFEFLFVSDEPKCPKCGAGSTDQPPVRLRTLIHLIVPDVKGPIPGMYSRWRMLCDPKRDYLATGSNHEAASDSIHAVNCPECLKKAHALSITKPLGSPLTAQAFLKDQKRG